MLLGKRPRLPIKRTTSMSGITLTADPPSDDDNNNNSPLESSQPSHPHAPQEDQLGQVPDHFIGYHQYYHTNIMSPRNNKARGGGGGDQLFVETAHFLRTCGLCQRRLAPGKDIYMYRGDTAFCSLECREQQMKQDGRREKCKVVTASNNEEPHSSSSTTTSTTPTTKAASRKSETVAAA